MWFDNVNSFCASCCFSLFCVCTLQSLSQEQLKDYSLQKANFKKEEEDTSDESDTEEEEEEEEDDNDEDSSADGKDGNSGNQQVCKFL